MSKAGTSANDLSDDERSREEVHLYDEEGGYWVDDIYIPPPPIPPIKTEDDVPRLIIVKIENNYFKNYAESCTIGPFHKQFNTVVGQSGSGKSNVIDSLLFVFGYQASNITSEELSTLIHNSETFQNGQSCTVAVHFAQITDQEGDAYNIIPGSEFVISRTANINNSSYYEIDEQRVEFKDVALLLRQHGIDLDNRFLILQNEIEQISFMKQKAETKDETGLLEYLEDMLGTGRYREPIAKLTERYRELSDIRNLKLKRCKLAEMNLNKLKKLMREAVGYLNLENNIISARNIIIQCEINNVEEKLASKTYEKEAIELELNELNGQIKYFQLEQNDLRKKYDQKTKEYCALQASEEKCKKVFNLMNVKAFEFQAKVKELNKTKDIMKSQLDTQNHKKVELDNLSEKANKCIKELRAKEEELVKKKDKLDHEKQTTLANITVCTKELQERREVLQEDLIPLRQKVDEAKSAFILAEYELNRYTSNVARKQEELDMLKTTYENIKQTKIGKKHEADNLNQEIQNAEKQLQEATKEFEELTTRQQKLKTERRDKMAKIEMNKSAMQFSKSKRRVLDILTHQKREGKCPGLFGRLGDLGVIDQKYDVAVSTACDVLDHIVVDTVDTVKWCIRFLKKYNIGSGSFIVLDRQKHLRSSANSPIETPENIPRLYDLIRVKDERVKTAFYFALRDTLVAENLDQACRIAYGSRRYRVVTLAGAVIETSGTMTGGGNTDSRPRMGQSVGVADIQPEDIKRMQKELQEMEEEFSRNRERLITLDTQITELNPKSREMKVALHKLIIEVKSLKLQELTLLKRLNQQTENGKDIKLDPNKMNNLTLVMEKCKKEFDEAQNNAAAFQVEVDAIKKEIFDKSSGRVQTIDKKIKLVAENLEAVRTQITKDKVSIITTARHLENCKGTILNIEQNIVDIENKLRDLMARLDRIDSNGLQMKKHMEQLSLHISKTAVELVETKKGITAVEKKEHNLKLSAIDVNGKLRTVDKQVNQLQTTILGYRSDLSQLKYYKVPDQPLQELHTYTVEELAKKKIGVLNREIENCKKALQGQEPNFAAIGDYYKRNEEYKTKLAELETLNKQRNKISSALNSVKKRRKKEFLTAFNIIRMLLQQMYHTITLGGNADLELVDSRDPFAKGIRMKAQPPGKSWENVTNLSGGEKILSSLALVFTLHYYKPSPLYLMDEIDAALDFRNVSIIAHFIKERAKNTQFIIVSRRPNMFEVGNYLIGICKVDDSAKAVTLDMSNFERVSEQQ